MSFENIIANATAESTILIDHLKPVIKIVAQSNLYSQCNQMQCKQIRLYLHT